MRVRASVGGWSFPIGLAALWAMVVPTLGQAQEIGLATDVDRTGYRAADGAPARVEIAEDDGVFLLDRISTDANGRLRLELDDASVLVVGPDSRMVIDEFVYDGGSGSFVGNLTVGGFRFLSGDMPSSSYRIETPTAVVGLRGTDVIVTYDPVGRITLVFVLAGEAWVLPLGEEETAQVEAGQLAEVLAGVPAVVRAAGPTPRWSRITTEEPFDVRSREQGGGADASTSDSDSDDGGSSGSQGNSPD